MHSCLRKMKTDDNTPIDDINSITNPNTKTLIDRYVFASNFCKHKDVLDAPCGHGYGSMLLKSLGAKSVHGIDIDKKALDKCINLYKEKSVKYSYQDLTDPMSDWKQGSFDAIVSIEGFEHVSRDDVVQLLYNFRYLAKKDATIIITTPIRYSEKWNYQGGTHLYEYSLDEFEEVIGNVFPNFEIWYGVEFRHPSSNELMTSFTKNENYKYKARIQIAKIINKE